MQCDNCGQMTLKARYCSLLGGKKKRWMAVCICGQRHHFDKDGLWHSRYYGMKYGELDRFKFPKLLQVELGQ